MNDTNTSDRPAWVAFLRGINVGGKHILPMEQLRTMFADQGCQHVRSLIQSGNIVFQADATLAGRLSRSIPEEIERQCGFRADIVIKSSAELEETMQNNPFLAEHGDPSRLHAAFLPGRPEPGRVEHLDPDHSHPDRFAVAGSVIYLDCPNGLARTRLTNAWFDSRLNTVCTMRNWKTLGKILVMLRQ